MFSGELPGNMWRAIDYVRREGLDEQIRKGAQRAGALGEYQSLLKDWSAFESDWKDMSSVARKGGSPLAIARQAPNVETLIPQLGGKTGNLLFERLGKYSSKGADMRLAEGVRRLGTEIENLEKPGAGPKMPGKVELPPTPAYRPSVARPTPSGVRSLEMLNRAGLPFRWWEYSPLGAPHWVLKSAAVRDLLSRIPREELPVTPELIEAYRALQGKPEGTK